MYKVFIKRIVDILISLVAIAFFSPIVIVLTLLLIVNIKSYKIFFIQKRPGRNGVIFKAIKFKTMTDEKDDNGDLLPDGKRLTKLGKFIRSSSLDELPQLLNVLKGDMSIVGPRPLLVKYLPLYSQEQARRHKVRPGLTGWAQINGRNSISWEDKFKHDIWYVDHVSFMLDIRIMWLTIFKLFRRDGINSMNSATMEPFKGNNMG